MRKAFLVILLFTVLAMGAWAKIPDCDGMLDMTVPIKMSFGLETDEGTYIPFDGNVPVKFEIVQRCNAINLFYVSGVQYMFGNCGGGVNWRIEDIRGNTVYTENTASYSLVWNGVPNSHNYESMETYRSTILQVEASCVNPPSSSTVFGGAVYTSVSSAKLNDYPYYGDYYAGGTGDEFDGEESEYKDGDCKFEWGVFDCGRKNSEKMRCKTGDEVVDGRSKKCDRGVISCKTDKGAILICERPKEDTTTSTEDDTDEEDGTSGDGGTEDEESWMVPDVCKDSDGGQYIYSKGTVITPAGLRETDNCADETTVRENFCSDSQHSGQALLNCPDNYKCDDGACVKTQQVSDFNFEISESLNQQEGTADITFTWSTVTPSSSKVTCGTSQKFYESTVTSHSVTLKGLELKEHSCVISSFTGTGGKLYAYPEFDLGNLKDSLDSGAPTKPTYLSITTSSEDASIKEIRCSGSTDVEDGMIYGGYEIETDHYGYWNGVDTDGVGYYELKTSSYKPLKNVRCRAYDSVGNKGEWLEKEVDSTLTMSNAKYFVERDYSKAPDELAYDIRFKWTTSDYATSEVECVLLDSIDKDEEPSYLDTRLSASSDEYIKSHDIYLDEQVGNKFLTCTLTSKDYNHNEATEVLKFETLNNEAPVIESFSAEFEMPVGTTEYDQNKVIANCQATDVDLNQVYYNIIVMEGHAYSMDYLDVESLERAEESPWYLKVKSIDNRYHIDITDYNKYFIGEDGTKQKIISFTVACQATDGVEASKWETVHMRFDNHVSEFTVESATVDSSGKTMIEITTDEPTTISLSCQGVEKYSSLSTNHKMTLNVPLQVGVDISPFSCTGTIADKYRNEHQLIGVHAIDVEVVGGLTGPGGEAVGGATGGAAANPFRSGPSGGAGGIGAAGGPKFGFQGEEQYDDGMFMQYWDWVFTMFPFLAA